MAVSERTLSEFLQHSGEVLPDLLEGEVLLHRRSGEDLVLLTKKQRDALQLTLHAFLRAAHGGTGEVSHAIPWFGFLSGSDQEACLDELRSVALGALESGRLAQLVETLYSWRATALAVWDERQRRRRSGDDVDEPLALPRPR